MNDPRCMLCGAKMRRNGSTSSGRQRWRCISCGSSTVRKIDSRAKDLAYFLDWLFSKDSIADKKVSRATFWRRTSWIWSLWPIALSMLVSDGARGLARAASTIWPTTRIQRCTFHAASQVKRYTTLNPKLECGRELLGIANKLMRVKDAEAAAAWLVRYNDWCMKWERFLCEFTIKDSKRIYTHERLRKARRSLNKLVHAGQLLTFIEMAEDRAAHGLDQ